MQHIASVTIVLWIVFSVPAPLFRCSQAVAADEQVTIICEHCGKEVSGTAAYGQQCPFCGVLWNIVAEAPPETSVTKSAAGFTKTQVIQDPRVLAPGTPIPKKQATPAAQPQARIPVPVTPESDFSGAPPPPPPLNGNAQGTTLSNMPAWMKGICFFEALGLMYYTLFVRR